MEKYIRHILLFFCRLSPDIWDYRDIFLSRTWDNNKKDNLNPSNLYDKGNIYMIVSNIFRKINFSRLVAGS